MFFENFVFMKKHVIFNRHYFPVNPYVSDGFVVKRGKWSQECAADSSSSSDETFYLKVRTIGDYVK